jgi:hypothetical protein
VVVCGALVMFCCFAVMFGGLVCHGILLVVNVLMKLMAKCSKTNLAASVYKKINCGSYLTGAGSSTIQKAPREVLARQNFPRGQPHWQTIGMVNHET